MISCTPSNHPARCLFHCCMCVCVCACRLYISIYKHVYVHIHISALSQPAASPCQGHTGQLLAHSEGLALLGEGVRGGMWLEVLWRGAFRVCPTSFPSSLPAREELGVLARSQCHPEDPRAQVTTALGAPRGICAFLSAGACVCCKPEGPAGVGTHCCTAPSPLFLLSPHL